jgi:hypothetical protein
MQLRSLNHLRSASHCRAATAAGLGGSGAGRGPAGGGALLYMASSKNQENRVC